MIDMIRAITLGNSFLGRLNCLVRARFEHAVMSEPCRFCRVRALLHASLRDFPAQRVDEGLDQFRTRLEVGIEQPHVEADRGMKWPRDDARRPELGGREVQAALRGRSPKDPGTPGLLDPDTLTFLSYKTPTGTPRSGVSSRSRRACCDRGRPPGCGRPWFQSSRPRT